MAQIEKNGKKLPTRPTLDIYILEKKIFWAYLFGDICWKYVQVQNISQPGKS